MQCLECSTDNPETARFCIECGTSLSLGQQASDPVPAAPEAAPAGNIVPPEGAREIGSLAGTTSVEGTGSSDVGAEDAAPAAEGGTADPPGPPSAPTIDPPGPPSSPGAVAPPPGSTPPAGAGTLAPSAPAAAYAQPGAPGAAGYAAPAAPAPAPAPQLAPAPVPTATDPFALGGAAGRMSAEAQGTARSALIAAAVLMIPGEHVESVCQGTVEGAPGLMVLTDRRLLVLNQRDWSPFVTWFAIDSGFALQPWEDGTGATVNVSGGGRTAVVSGIQDKQPTYDLVARINRRLGR